MGQHGDVRILHRADDPSRHVRFGKGEGGMHGGDDVIQLSQDFVGKIKRAIAEDVALDPGEEPEVFEFGIQFPNARELDAQPRFIESARLDRAAAVIGDPEILQAEFLRRRGHFFGRIATIARRGVAMESAAQILRLDEGRKFSRGRSFKFAAVFAQLRRDIIEIERTIKIGFLANDRDLLRRLPPWHRRLACGASGHLARCLVLIRGINGRDARCPHRQDACATGFGIDWRLTEPIFVQGPAALQRPAPHLDVMLLAPGKIIQRERIFRRCHHPQVALNSRAQSYARFRRPVRDDRLSERMLDKHGRDFRRRIGRHDEIEIAHNFLPAAITAGDANVQRVWMGAEIVLQLFRFRRDLPERERAGVFLAFVYGPTEFLLRRLAEPRQLRDAACDAGFMQLRDRADLQFFVERLDLLRAQPGKRKQFQNVRRKFRAQFVEEFQRTGLDQLFDLRRDRFADSRNFFEDFFVGEISDISAPGFERARRVDVGPNLERIFILQLEKRRDLLEHVRDRRLVHGAFLPKSSKHQAPSTREAPNIKAPKEAPLN